MSEMKNSYEIENQKIYNRLETVIAKITSFFEENLLTNKDIAIRFYLAGSCLKSDTFRDIDLIFPNESEYEKLIEGLDQKDFLYKNNSNTYRFNGDVIQLACLPRYTNKTLGEVIDDFDFASTKIGFEYRLVFKPVQCIGISLDIRDDFLNYLVSKKNPVCKINTNPFITLNRAMHFLKKGDDVPMSTILNLMEEIQKLHVREEIDIDSFLMGFSGNDQSLKVIRNDIREYLINKRKTKEWRCWKINMKFLIKMENTVLLNLLQIRLSYLRNMIM
jgi:hypothetical protein